MVWVYGYKLTRARPNVRFLSYWLLDLHPLPATSLAPSALVRLPSALTSCTLSNFAPFSRLPLPTVTTTMSSAVPSKLAPPPVLYSFVDPDALAQGLGSFVIAAQTEALKKNSTFRIAVSGGSLPKVLGQGLFGRQGVQWDKWCVLLDRLVRYVPVADPYLCLPGRSSLPTSE